MLRGIQIEKLIIICVDKQFGVKGLSMRSSPMEVLRKKGVLKNFTKFTGKHLCQSCNFIKKQTLAQVFSCEFCEIFENTYFYRTPLVAASVSMTFERNVKQCYEK